MCYILILYVWKYLMKILEKIYNYLCLSCIIFYIKMYKKDYDSRIL